MIVNLNRPLCICLVELYNSSSQLVLLDTSSNVALILIFFWFVEVYYLKLAVMRLLIETFFNNAS